MDTRREIQLSELILRELDGMCNDEEFARLEKWLTEDPLALEFYAEMVITNSTLREPQSIASDKSGMHIFDHEYYLPESGMDTRLWLALAESEATAEAVYVEKPRNNANAQSGLSVSPKTVERRQISKLAVRTLIVASAAMFFLMFLVWMTPAGPQVVGRIIDSVDAQWDDISQTVVGDGGVLEGRPLILLSGFAEIELLDGATVLLHGPCQTELETANQVFLYGGKLSSVVPKKAVGFTVRTPVATVVDYGTEFGVDVSDNGETEAHVFKGEVDLRTGTNTRVYDHSRRISAGQASMVDDTGRIVVRSIAESMFVRDVEDVRISDKMLNRNLIVNGDFEAGDIAEYDPTNNSLTNVDVYGWQDYCRAVAISYDKTASFGYPNPETDVVPADRGKNFFVGAEQGKIYQEIDIAGLDYYVDSRTIRYELSGWLGAFGSDQEDSIEVTATFYDRFGYDMVSGKIGPITLADRGSKTGFVELMDKGAVPVGCRKIRITIQSFHGNGDLTDAYADNLKLVLKGK
ncbi:MAG: FecR domain-containing protein [Anaerohalosphaera sp.]|nr:FecR domain-containing protein [Anaerohalosphaera sp.]